MITENNNTSARNRTGCSALRFTKWQGLGNDFVVVEAATPEEMELAGIAKNICDRRLGVGADGLVPIRRRSGNEFDMRIFNADGSEAEMCGNVSRCVALYIKERGLSDADEYILRTKAGAITVRPIDAGNVRVDMGAPRLKRGEIPLAGDPAVDALSVEIAAGNEIFFGTGVSMGNPHFVIFVPRIADVAVEKFGPILETAPVFPKKTNVEFVEVLDTETVRMRVWERGCGITPACGTGACATAVAGVLTGKTGSRVRVVLDGGALEIEYNREHNRVFMTGPAKKVFAGEIGL